MLRAAVLLLAVMCTTAGCSLKFHSSYSSSKKLDCPHTTSAVKGFGEGSTRSIAEANAWDDAIVRIKRMGLAIDQVESRNEQIQNRNNGKYAAKVTLIVTSLVCDCHTGQGEHKRHARDSDHADHSSLRKPPPPAHRPPNHDRPAGDHDEHMHDERPATRSLSAED